MTTKLCCLKTKPRDLKARNTTAVVHSNTLHILNFPPPPKRGKECSTTYCNVYGSALLVMQALAVMCTAVRWCCCRLFLLSRRYPHGGHHARDIANTPETHHSVGTSSDTIHASYLPHRDQTNQVDPLEGHYETVGSADHNIQKNRANTPKRGHRSSPKVNTRQKHKTKIPNINSTRKNPKL